jgi:hypothetical protein
MLHGRDRSQKRSVAAFAVGDVWPCIRSHLRVASHRQARVNHEDRRHRRHRLIGSKTVAILRQGGHEVVAASPKSGVNTITGEGVKEAVAGAQVVIDLANSPSFEDKAVLADRARTRSERRPRRSIEERHPSKAAYLDQVRRAADGLIEDGYLLPEDVEGILAHSARRWDLLASVPEAAAAK